MKLTKQQLKQIIKEVFQAEKVDIFDLSYSLEEKA